MMMRARLRSLGQGDDRGMTLVEVLLAAVLSVVVGTITTTAFVGTHKLFRTTDDETSGLADVRTASERLAKDVRDARSVLCNPTGTPAAVVSDDPTCVRHLQLWIDYNSDYIQQSDETVTWSLVNTSVAGHHNMTRTVGTVTQTEARTIVSQVAFAYDVQPGSSAPAPGAAHTSLVNTSMQYDALLTSGTTTRTVTFSARVRNVR
jgi:Tfp pilus assembly protein PilW